MLHDARAQGAMHAMHPVSAERASYFLLQVGCSLPFFLPFFFKIK
jgi:hypothetical protein